MADDFARFVIRHDLQKAGVNPSAPVSATSLIELGQEVGKMIGQLRQRIEALEKKLSGQQKKLDHLDDHALVFRGDWQVAERYYPGCCVRHNGGVYTALREISPGKAEPGRQGAGWDRII